MRGGITGQHLWLAQEVGQTCGIEPSSRESALSLDCVRIELRDTQLMSTDELLEVKGKTHIFGHTSCDH